MIYKPFFIWITYASLNRNIRNHWNTIGKRLWWTCLVTGQTISKGIKVGDILDINRPLGIFKGVRFTNCAQDNYFEHFDPRYALAFLRVNEWEGHLNTVQNCIFDQPNGIAIGLIASNDISLVENVVYKPLYTGISFERYKAYNKNEI